MFLSPKLIAIMALSLMTCTLLAQNVSAQGSHNTKPDCKQCKTRELAPSKQLNSKRMEMSSQRPINRASITKPTRTSSGHGHAPRPVAWVLRHRGSAGRQTTVQRSASPVRTASRSGSNPAQYTPQHLRTAQIYDGQIIDDGAPIISGTPMMSDTPTMSGVPMMPNSPMVSGTPVISGSACGGGCGSCGGGCSSGACGGAVYSGVVSEVVSDCGSCGSCGPCGLDVPCCDRGGCPPGTFENCWIGRLGLILQNAEYFVGATAFKGPSFTTPGTDTFQQTHDCNFGLYGGVNLGIPLCKLSCGLLSGQIGARDGARATSMEVRRPPKVATSYF